MISFRFMIRWKYHHFLQLQWCFDSVDSCWICPRSREDGACQLHCGKDLLQDGNVEPHFISCSNGSSTIASFDEVLHLHPEMHQIFSCAQGVDMVLFFLLKWISCTWHRSNPSNKQMMTICEAVEQLFQKYFMDSPVLSTSQAVFVCPSWVFFFPAATRPTNSCSAGT